MAIPRPVSTIPPGHSPSRTHRKCRNSGTAQASVQYACSVTPGKGIGGGAFHAMGGAHPRHDRNTAASRGGQLTALATGPQLSDQGKGVGGDPPVTGGETGT